jgi:hypothetical protein
MSSKAVRAIPFFACIASLMIARYGGMTFRILANSKMICNLKVKLSKPVLFISSPDTKKVFYFLLSILLIVLILNSNLFQSGVQRKRYPAGAVDFLKANKIHGNMFNPYDWGGYLIWSLYPDYKVFIDGRGLIEEVLFQSEAISHVHPTFIGGLPEWKAFLQAYNANFIITSSVNEFSGKLGPLVPELIKDPEWHLIYMDDISLIFLKDGSDNAEIINKFGMPNEWALNEVITEAVIKLLKFKKNVNFYITIGDAYAAKYNYREAKVAYLKAKTVEPENAVIMKKLDAVELNLK